MAGRHGGNLVDLSYPFGWAESSRRKRIWSRKNIGGKSATLTTQRWLPWKLRRTPDIRSSLVIFSSHQDHTLHQCLAQRPCSPFNHTAWFPNPLLLLVLWSYTGFGHGFWAETYRRLRDVSAERKTCKDLKNVCHQPVEASIYLLSWSRKLIVAMSLTLAIFSSQS